MVKVGKVAVGGDNRIAIQSMVTSPTQDISATVQQSIALAEAGCDIVRITAQNVKAAEALGPIRKQFTAAGFGDIPLVADIHFLPQAAMEAARHVEKVRINPGNYADKKKFLVKEYSDIEYNEELERLHDAFSPIVLRCKDLGRAMRIGTNHGSLSDRIMNRYGDSPLGMCESALEFIRISASHGFHDIVLSMKASNPKVMIQAYRLMVAKMAAEDMFYPLHLGVTEAGDGDDARIKSAIGIGSLLYDGLGDTIRVSLTEDPVAEVPVAQALAAKAEALWTESAPETLPDEVDPYEFTRRPIEDGLIGNSLKLGSMEPPLVIQPGPPVDAVPSPADYSTSLAGAQAALGDARIEGLLLPVTEGLLDNPEGWREAIGETVEAVVWDTSGFTLQDRDYENLRSATRSGDLWLTEFTSRPDWGQFCQQAEKCNIRTALAIWPDQMHELFQEDLVCGGNPVILTLPAKTRIVSDVHPVGHYRTLAEMLRTMESANPIWIRNTTESAIESDPEEFSDRLLEASMLSGSLICDGIGDILSIETVGQIRQSTTLAYNILQGARARTTKTEFVACPSCGRTLFDLQSTTQRIRAATGHLKGVTIAIMGCIVNGPGEMADADFGYVGGAPGKINLYVGKDCVKMHIPSDHAVEALIELIKEHGKWEEASANG